MTTHILQKDFRQVITDVMKYVEMDVEIREVHDGINMSYNFIGKYIGFDARRLHAAHLEMGPHCTLENYVQTITLHELGHAMDLQALEASLTKTIDIFSMKKSHSAEEIFTTPELMKMIVEEHKMNISFEQTAWTNAKKINEKYNVVDHKCFYGILEKSMATYEKVYQHDLLCYQTLIEQHKTPVA